jgi:hypothetical protein
MSQTRYCPYCKQPLEKWLAPPDTGWGEILVCFNNNCEFYTGSKDDILYKGEDQRHLGCRYAEDPSNNFESFNLLAICP